MRLIEILYYTIWNYAIVKRQIIYDLFLDYHLGQLYIGPMLEIPQATARQEAV